MKKICRGKIVANLIVKQINMNSEWCLYLKMAGVFNIFNRNLDKDTEGRLLKSNYKIIKNKSLNKLVNWAKIKKNECNILHWGFKESTI